VSAPAQMPFPLMQMRKALSHATQVLCKLAGPATAATLMRHEADTIELLAREAGTWDDSGQAELMNSLRAQLRSAIDQLAAEERSR
jgi:hypothetical protein